ncbi:sensor histidine kinase [Aquimarina intermedia]|uniref:histidine kinase n=1 Tax=Aquimarina intermedia TaxID=350814 RepID=A0A5S5BXT0_9FLAO|nr:PAS domain-containing sensor histidine kinase [Aquimarina intermedia]TYP70443.1 PAS domain S-box-containing protein [Aquimarina intermedia]
MTEKLPYKTLFEISQDLIAIANIDGYFKKLNPRWMTTLGYTEKEMLGRPFINFVHPEDRLKTDEVAQKQKKGLTVSKFENRYLTKNGDIIYLEWNATIVDETGDIFAIARNQTELKEKELKLQESEEILKLKNQQFQDLFNLSQDLIVIAHRDGYFKKVNPQWTEKFGYSEDEVLSTPFIDFIHPDDRSKTANMVQDQLNGVTAMQFHNRYIAKNGDILHLEWNATAVDATGLIFAIARDQTESIDQKKALTTSITKLSAKNNQLQDFAYIASHNLRSPVANIFILTKFLIDSNLDKEQHKYANLIHDSTEALNNTLEDLLHVVQLNKTTDANAQRISLKEVCNTVLKQLHGTVLTNQAQIITDFEEIDTIEYPEGYLHSIFLNLISNAIKYRSPDRSPIIQIKSKKNETSVELSFEDNGIGIDLSKHHNKIFGFRKTFHNHPEARGFGLYITKSQVEALNGEISVQSELDKGTKFIINLAS